MKFNQYAVVVANRNRKSAYIRRKGKTLDFIWRLSCMHNSG